MSFSLYQEEGSSVSWWVRVLELHPDSTSKSVVFKSNQFMRMGVVGLMFVDKVSISSFFCSNSFNFHFQVDGESSSSFFIDKKPLLS